VEHLQGRPTTTQVEDPARMLSRPLVSNLGPVGVDLKHRHRCHPVNDRFEITPLIAGPA
jgi:hypothetical protein